MEAMIYITKHMKFQKFQKSENPPSKNHISVRTKHALHLKHSLIFFQNHSIIMISDIKTQFSLESFHSETKEKILQKSKFSKNNLKSIQFFKRFFIAKGSLPFSIF